MHSRDAMEIGNRLVSALDKITEVLTALTKRVAKIDENTDRKPWWEEAGLPSPPKDHKKFPVRFHADCGETTTIGEVLDQIVHAYETGGDAAAREVIDELFLWGCWGTRIDAMMERAPDTIDFLRNLRGLVVAAIKSTGDSRQVGCRSCPFAKEGEVFHEGGTGTPAYRHPSLFCGAAEDALIVDTREKPAFCPLPMRLVWKGVA